jgi:hypothetical protein
MATSNLFPPLDADTEAALRVSIERYGVLVPIVVDIDGNVIDGNHRLRIYRESFYAIQGEYGESHTDIPGRLPFIVAAKEPLPREPPELRITALSNWRRNNPRADPAVLGEHLAWLVVPVGGMAEMVGPVVVVPSFDRVDIARTLNLDRRQIDSETRRQMEADLRTDGHSYRAIAKVVGVGEGQVRKDIKAEELRTGTQLGPA